MTKQNQGFISIPLLIGIIVILAVGGILAWQYFGAPEFTYNIRECEKGAERKFEEFKINSEANAILFEGFLNTYCNMKPKENLFMSYGKQDTEIDLKLIINPKGGEVAECICPFSVHGKIENLTSGKYQVRIIKENRYTYGIETLQTEEITIPKEKD